MDDPQLTQLLHDAVEDVEPTDRLAQIRQQTRPRRSRRWYAVGGAVLVTAVVVTGIAIAARPSPGPGPAPSHDPTAVDSGTPGTTAFAAYYLGDTPQGPRLYREFRQDQAQPALDTGLRLLTTPPDDPDYRTLWPADAFASAKVVDGQIEVEIADPAVVAFPSDMNADDAQLSVQQVVFTLQAAVGELLPVQFTYQGTRAPNVWGVPGSYPMARGSDLDVLALVSISNPAEGRVVEDHFSADGVASSFEGTVPWELRDANGTVVRQGSAQGTMEERLTSWATGPIDVSDLPPGTYTFAARTDDPTGGEGGGPTTDTRTVVIR
jgi:Immunoglobulin-like domain of bacterial spore germination/Sporulation and spore germination